MLLQNYPNPFNPETWIPFKLAERSNVVISIYDISGQLIRKIGLDNIPAGVYTSKDRAFYWDGCNDDKYQAEFMGRVREAIEQKSCTKCNRRMQLDWQCCPYDGTNIAN